MEQTLYSPAPLLTSDHRPLMSSTPLSNYRSHSGISSLLRVEYDQVDGYRLLHDTKSYSDGLHPVLSGRSRGSCQVYTHRQKIVREIFDTEHSYISQLTTVVSLFLKPIRVSCLLPAEMITTIFSNIESILSVNKELFSYMRQKSLGEAFSYLGPFLKLYSTYAKSYQDANRKLQECLKKESAFRSFVISQESRPECCAQRLASLLLTPVQRIPRYKLLLEDLLKNTKVTHTDYTRLKAASNQIASVTSHINEHVRQHENFKKMLSIQKSLVGQSTPNILSPGRSFIHEGKLMKVCRTNKKPKERMVFLFSDVLMYARPMRHERKDFQRCYLYRCALPLIHSTVKILSEDERVPGINCLVMVSNDDTTLIFFSHQNEVVVKWATTIKGVISELQHVYGTESLVPDKTLKPDTVLPSSFEVVENNKSLLDQQMMSTHYPLTTTLFSPRSCPEPTLQHIDTNHNSALISREKQKVDKTHTHRSHSHPEFGQNHNSVHVKELVEHEESADNQLHLTSLCKQLPLDDHSTSLESESGKRDPCQEQSRVDVETGAGQSYCDVQKTNFINPPLDVIRSLSTMYPVENRYLDSKCCTIL